MPILQQSAHPRTAYDEVPYPGATFPQTHPDRLCALAALHGMQPAPVEACRVLELGCGEGANLLPMALGLPGSTFLGVDLAGSAIARAAATADALGLRNVRFQHADLLDLPEDLGPFDYVIAHGVYSWVPEAVQERLLVLCRALLAPHGVAYVSYNAYPGCHLRDMLREMMRFHVAGSSAPPERIGGALALVQFLASALPDGEGTASLRLELANVLERAPEVLLHDDLAEVNAPLSFHQFMQRAAAHGLQYLSEANYFETQVHGFPPSVVEALARIEQQRGLIHREQYLDFVKLRRFRQTLLCHQAVALQRPPEHALVRRLLVSSRARPTSPAPDPRPGVAQTFEAPRGVAATTDHPLAKRVLLALGERWPERVAFDRLLDLAQARSETEAADAAASDDPVPAAPAGAAEHVVDPGTLAAMLLDMYGMGLLELHAHRPPVAFEASSAPVASPLARLQAGGGERMISTLLHERVRLEDEVGRYALTLLDGSRDRPALVAALQAWLREHRESASDGTSLPTPESVDADVLDRKLGELARMGVLLAWPARPRSCTTRA